MENTNTNAELASGNVCATMLNIGSSIEIMLSNFNEGKTQTFMGATKCNKHTVDGGECYMFGPIDMPGLLKDSLFSIVSFIHVNDNSGSFYLVSIDIREPTGETFCNFECKVDSKVFDQAKAAYKKISGE